MTNKLFLGCIFLICLGLGKAYAATALINHQINVRLNPEEQTFQVIDSIQLGQAGSHEFMLHAGLQPQLMSSGASLSLKHSISGEIPIEIYQVTLPPGEAEFTLQYAGKIAHNFRSRIESPGRQQQTLSGTISPQGVFLDGGVAWYPLFADSLQTFSLDVQLPDTWYAVSQGDGPVVQSGQSGKQVSWQALTPQDDIYLIAGAYQFYSHRGDAAESQVFLRQPDRKLAERYLQVTDYYLKLYQQLIGPYAYPKFALVENFWETGFGMPSFTLLGSQVIRLPFILHTSYPHEILHNWWGNGVLVDYASGNWSEGLTSYLADHLLKEQRGLGVDYRRSALQRYSNFVRSENDFPLSQFRSRHSGSSQAIGYDKSLMFFHMLRRQLGDQIFIEGLRLFYRQNLFKTAGFSDLQQAFEQISSKDLAGFFQQWLQRTGAPAIAVRDVQVMAQGQAYQVSGTLLQTQTGQPFQIDVPMIAYSEDGMATRTAVAMTSKEQPFSIQLQAKAVRLDVDPWFDLFRQLDADEAPATFGQIFGSQQVLFVLPSNAPEDLLSAYRVMVKQWSAGYEKASIRLDTDFEQLPDDSVIWLLGWQNRFVRQIQNQLQADQYTQTGASISVAGHPLDPSAKSLVLINRNTDTRQLIAWLGSDNAKSISGLTRKVPHYGKYSYLVFAGESPDNLYKGQWSVSNSPLRIPFSDTSSSVKELQPEVLWNSN